MASDTNSQISKFPKLRFNARLSSFLYSITSHIRTHIQAVSSIPFRRYAHLNEKVVFLC